MKKFWVTYAMHDSSFTVKREAESLKLMYISMSNEIMVTKERNELLIIIDDAEEITGVNPFRIESITVVGVSE